jgi:Copper chaperone
MAISLKIEGMHCGGCVRSVEKAAAGVDGVRNVRVDLDRGEMTADLDRPELLAALTAAIEETGFDVVSGQ